MRKINSNASYVVDRLVAARCEVKPIIISGFWRSGTTWLQEITAEAVEAKTIFEPLDRDSLIPFLRGKENVYRGYIPTSISEFSEADWRYLDLAFKGISPHRSSFCYLCRDGVRDALRSGLVIKFVRAQFVLRDLMTLYKPEATIHIYRHPMSVVRSMMKSGWDWSFDGIFFSNFYGANLSGKPDGISRLVHENPKSEHVKIAALWAITEQYVREVPNVTFCQYESLLSNPLAAFSETISRAGLRQINVPNFWKDSPVTTSTRSTQDRLNSWRSDIPSEIQFDIKATLRDYWPKVDDYWDLS